MPFLHKSRNNRFLHFLRKAIKKNWAQFTKMQWFKELFSTEIVQDGKTKAKKNKKKGDKKDQELDDSLRVKTVEPLTYDKLTEGFKTLARISEIRDLDLKLSLPGRLVAWVPILQISNSYTDALKKVTEKPEISETLGIRPLTEMFQQGQLISCSIVKVCITT